METTSGIKIKTENLSSYKGIVEPGRYELTVASNVTLANRVTDEGGANPRYIVNLKAIALDKFEQVKQVFAGKSEVSIEDTNGCFLTANIWEREGQTADLPMKGEIIDATIDFVEGREGQQLLRVTNLKRKPAKAAKSFDLVAMLAPAEVSAPASELVHS